jgi:hypothetical protein
MASAPDYNAIYQQSLEQARQAAQPAISSLESQRPTIESGYQNTLGQLNTQQNSQIGDTNTTTTRSFGERGVPINSSLFSQTLEHNVKPIREYYTGQIGAAGQQRDTALSALQAQLGQLQSGYQTNAIQAAQGMYGQQLGAFNAEQDRAAQERQAALSRGAAASQNASQLAAQQAAYKQAQDALNAQNQKGYTTGALNYLTGAAINGGQYTNTSVDQNELDQAYQYLINQGLDKNSAISTISSAFKNQGLSPYQLSGDAKKFYGI